MYSFSFHVTENTALFHYKVQLVNIPQGKYLYATYYRNCTTPINNGKIWSLLMLHGWYECIWLPLGYKWLHVALNRLCCRVTSNCIFFHTGIITETSNWIFGFRVSVVSYNPPNNLAQTQIRILHWLLRKFDLGYLLLNKFGNYCG
jgi:hypothetical protein